MRATPAILLGLALGFPGPGVAAATSARLSVNCNVVSRVSVRTDAGVLLHAATARGVSATVTPALGVSTKPYVLVQRRAADASGPEVVVVTVLADGGPTAGAVAAGRSASSAITAAAR